MLQSLSYLDLMSVKPVLYQFETTWELQASLPEVWDVIYNSDQWPLWWKGVLSVKRLRDGMSGIPVNAPNNLHDKNHDVPGDDNFNSTPTGSSNGLHAVNAYVWKSWLPYELHFTLELVEEVPLKLIRCKADGELAGEGIFRISEANGIVSVRYNWNVYTQKNWMNILAPLARPFFYYNHKLVMKWGAEGLAKKLHAKLAGFSSRP